METTMLVSGAVGLLFTSGVLTLVVWQYERRSEREAPLKLAVILMAAILGSWLLMTAMVVLTAFAVSALLSV